MKTQEKQGSFIVLIWTLIAKVKQVTNARCVPIYPRADMVASLLLGPVIFRCMQRRQAEEARLSQRVFRYSSARPYLPSFTSSFFVGGAGVTHASAPKR